MKRILFLTVVTIALYSCNSTPSTSANDTKSRPAVQPDTIKDTKEPLMLSGKPNDGAAIPTDDNKIYTAVENEPEPIGGMQKFYDFLGNKIKYPKAAKEAGTQGKVIVKFIVEKDGSLTAIQVLREPGNGLGDEAVRVLKIAPRWKPGIQNGKPVRVEYTIPVNFSLGDQN